MKTNVILLEEAYHVVRVRQILLAEGYTAEQIDLLIERGFMDKVKRGAMIGATALGMMGGSAKANDIDDFLNKTRGEVSSAISDASSKFKKSQEDANKQAQIDLAKMDKIEKRFNKEIVPLLSKGYEASANVIYSLIGDITANGMANGRKDYDKQLESLDKVKEVLQKTSGLAQKNEVEKMLKSVYYKY